MIQAHHLMPVYALPASVQCIKKSQLNHTGCSDTFGGHLTLCLLKRAVVIMSTSSFQLGLNSILVLKDDGSPSVPTYRVVFYSSPLTLIHILLESRESHTRTTRKLCLRNRPPSGRLASLNSLTQLHCPLCLENWRTRRPPGSYCSSSSSFSTTSLPTFIVPLLLLFDGSRSHPSQAWK